VIESIVERERRMREHRWRLVDATLAAGEPVRVTYEYNRGPAEIDPLRFSAFFSGVCPTAFGDRVS
jgi:hypothetical protein